jgi:hypothetical protein
MGPALERAKVLGLQATPQVAIMIPTMVLVEGLGMVAMGAQAVQPMGWLVLELEDHLMGLPGSPRPLGLVVALGVGIIQVVATSVHLATLWLEELEEAGYV